jgi:hypothetical protein
MRKMTIEAMNKTKKRGNSTVIGVPDDQNYFMPKVSKLRPDGASLLSIYDSKRQDLWGQIIRAQVVEDEVEKRVKRRQHEVSNSKYSELLTEQVADKEEMLQRQRDYEKKTAGFTPGGMFEVIDEKQKKRDALAKLGQVEYVSNAMHDMALKRTQKDRVLQEELEGAAVLAREAMYQSELEKDKVRRKKQEQIDRTESLFKENCDLIDDRTRKKMAKNRADIAYVKEVDAKFAREEAARRADVARRFHKANSDGPANEMTGLIKRLEQEETEKMFETLRTSENSLNRQLQKSEENAAKATVFKKTSLLGEYDKVAIKAKKLNDDLEREKEKARNDILSYQEQYKVDVKKQRQRRVEAATKYQSELNSQLDETRLRSLHNLRETMTEKERNFNSDLLQRLLK